VTLKEYDKLLEIMIWRAESLIANMTLNWHQKNMSANFEFHICKHILHPMWLRNISFHIAVRVNKTGGFCEKIGEIGRSQLFITDQF
jgi:hypothetical protein